MQPRISVLMPVWNRAHLVKNSIQSIFDQTFDNWELIIVDDGSTDNTIQILEECAKDEPRIRITECEHKGLVETLHRGNMEARGEIIVKQDSDDYSLPDRLEVIDNYFIEHPETEFFYHGMYQTWEDGNPTDLLRRVYLPALPIERDRILKEQYIPGCFAYTKDFIKHTPYRKTHCSEDWMLILDAYFRGHKIGYKNQGLYEYILRYDSNSMINEGTGAYEDDEAFMKRVLKKEYNIENFKYAERK